MRAYIVLSEQLGAPRSQSITESVGEICKHCRSGPSTRVRSNPASDVEKAKHKLVCLNCARDWDGKEIYQLKQFQGKTPKRAREVSPSEAEMFEQWHLVRALVEDRPKAFTQKRWDYVTLCLVAFLDPRIGTYENVSVYGAQRFKRRQWIWTPARARTAVRDARNELEHRGRLAGLLPERVQFQGLRRAG
jgi:hypothetical protein